ncbi:MAG TPA: cobalamin-independent methionine synthase II family protein [Stellaceae bacterium]|nr:cobalamin-independent methionine synthase II family protein [Stellaceae bacterium]
MAYGADHFLTTHTGSLPRPDDLIRAMFAKEEGVPVDRIALAARIRTAVGEVVKKQAEAGIDILNDGEMSKPSYATYVKDRLTGFAGASNSFVYQDLAEFPNLAQRVFGDPGRSRRRTPACTGPIGVADPAAPLTDIDNLKAALSEVDAAGAFLSAASPGVISLFFRNDHYATQDAYLFAIAEAMRGEYEAIAASGAIVQIDCPDLAMGRHIQYADLSLAEFRNRARLHVEALNHALAAIPPEQARLHLCWGNYEGPHHHDVPLADIIDIVFAARPATISFEAANPRHGHEWTLFEQVKLPEGKIIIPGVIESKSNFIEHPELIAQRIARYANLVGRDNVIAGSDCGFGTWVGQAAVDPDVVWAKLAAMAEGARLATKQFWGG